MNNPAGRMKKLLLLQRVGFRVDSSSRARGTRRPTDRWDGSFGGAAALRHEAQQQPRGRVPKQQQFADRPTDRPTDPALGKWVVRRQAGGQREPYAAELERNIYIYRPDGKPPVCRRRMHQRGAREGSWSTSGFEWNASSSSSSSWSQGSRESMDGRFFLCVCLVCVFLPIIINRGLAGDRQTNCIINDNTSLGQRMQTLGWLLLLGRRCDNDTWQ